MDFDVTNDYALRLATACLDLREVRIQGATKLTDEAVRAFLQHCPLLTNSRSPRMPMVRLT
jgi:hypothetical protein